ncbi:MAG: aldo/keto reductase [Deltaproteobacteria bacterium]|nr:aldo/keto reductase [Deltaproteobacteria bacterium]
MELRRLGQSGLKVSALSLGAMTFGESQTFMKGVTSPDDEGRRVFDRALDAGMNLVDTANVYSEGRSEELTGEWIAGKRDRVLLATKCRFPMGFGIKGNKPGPHAMGLSRQHILSACEDSLRRLKTDVIDLYQVHMQDSTVGIDETLRALDDLVRDGKVRYVGCSNYTGYRLVESLWSADRRNTTRFESVQLQWSLSVRDAEREVIPACRTFGLGTLIWSPLARGFLTGKYQRNQPAPAGTRLDAWKDSFRTLDNDHSWALLDVVREIAAKHDSTPAAISIAWLLAQKETSSIIVGARTVEQLDQNLAGLEIRLEPDDLAALDRASRPDWGYPYAFIGMREPW